jgi:hypothetical protein
LPDGNDQSAELDMDDGSVGIFTGIFFMRGIAMSRVAHMIADQRRRTYAAEVAEADDFLVA